MYVPFNPDQRVEMHPQTADLFIGMFKLRVIIGKKLKTALLWLKLGLVHLVEQHAATKGCEIYNDNVMLSQITPI